VLVCLMYEMMNVIFNLVGLDPTAVYLVNE
jgi:hypothetical protein